MAQFINPIGSGKQATPPGERRFGERLRLLLEDDYLCWHNVPVGPARHYPDFIVLHPGRGLLIFEVKDWRIDTLRGIDKHSVTIVTPEGTRKVAPNPLEQARGYCMTVVNKLSTDPQLQDPSNRFQGKICFPYGYGAVFPNITRRQLDDALSAEEQELVLPARLTICKDEMTESIPADQFQERIWKMFHYSFGVPLTLPQIERIRWHLFPDVRISAIQKDFFSDTTKDDQHELVPEIIRVMDLAQEQLARSLGTGHRVIHGVAGSGKTLILGYRCLHLARVLHKPVLILCFNITLAARLRSFVTEHQIADKVQVYHFHEWCKVQLTTYHAPLVQSEKEIWERQVESVIEGVAKGMIPRAQYGAILIDEGHDFAPDWLRLVTQMCDPNSDSLLLLYDDAQSIYQKQSRLNFSLSSVGIKAQGRTTILRLNYRNSREILTFAYDFAASFLQPADADDDHIPLIRPEAAGASGPRPVFRSHLSIDDEVKFAASCIRKWQQSGTQLNEIAILYFHTDQGRKMSERLNVDRIPSLWMAGFTNKAAYDPQKNEVAILPIPSSKGLEFRAVIILGIGHINHTNRDEADIARLLYVGMTRAKEKLLLTASAQNSFVDRLSAIAA